MGNKQTVICLILVCLYIGVGTFFAYRVIDKSIDYQRNMQAYAAALNYQERLLNLESWVKEGGETELLASANRKKARAETEFSKARQAACLLVAISVGFWALVQIFSVVHPHKKRWRATALMVIALVGLIVGLFCPMLEIAAFERDLQIPIRFETRLFSLNVDHTQVFEGDMYFYYQSKSIVKLISLLIRQGNWIVGGSIFAFSLLIPLLKVTFGFLQIWQFPFSRQPQLQKFMQKIAKWSMADVFVAAVFLAFLAFSNMETGIQTQSRTLIGLYFFLAYVLLSMWIGMGPDAATQKTATEI